jgi:hypothetical protein
LKYAEAERLYKRAMEIFEKALWPERPEVATILENYAALLRETNCEDEAVKLEARAKAIRDKQSNQNPK